MGEEIADFQLEFLMRECDSVSVGLAGRLAQEDLLRKAVGLLAKPTVVLQARSGSIGGNPVAIRSKST